MTKENQTTANEKSLFSRFSDLPNLSNFCIRLLDRFAEDETFSIDVNREENRISFSFFDTNIGKEVNVNFAICEENKEILE